jgi:hypothetical protein
MPLCIAGMHRSGTSMIASLLHICGLDLGPQVDFLPAAPDNPKGFWENRSFLRLNQAILENLGGSWDRPPQREVADWEDDINLHHLREKADELTRRFNGREPWGWKDPRNSLTLPLWRKLLPETKTLLCVRNPLAVAESLRLRNGFPYTDSFNLWLTYNRRVLTAAPAEFRLVTHYETYLIDPHAELRRVMQWVGLSAPEAQVNRACQDIAPSLIHHRMTLVELVDAGASAELLRYYRDLCAEAGLGELATNTAR